MYSAKEMNITTQYTLLATKIMKKRIFVKDYYMMMIQCDDQIFGLIRSFHWPSLTISVQMSTDD